MWKAISAAAVLAMAGSAGSAEDGDAAFGRTLAEEYCVRCHDIEPGGADKEYPPSFASIAVFRSPEQIRSRILFPPLHISMPRFSEYTISGNADDMVAYIQSLER